MAGALLLGLALPFVDHTVDDAYISLRYAENLALGHGLVFNPGERVEGYTNFLWTILASAAIAAGADPEPVAKVLGMLAALAVVAAVAYGAPRPRSAPELAWAAPLLAAASPPLAVWATAGLETPLFAALVAWAAVLTVTGVERGTMPWPAAVLAAAAALTRPEGVGVAGLLAAGGWLALWRGEGTARGATRATVRWLALFLALFLPYFLWRWGYYGAFLPNTFYAKVGTRWSQVVRGAAYVHQYGMAGGYLLALPLAGLVWSRRRRAVTVLVVLAAGLLAYVVAVGGDGLPMFRFLVPLLPPLLLLVGYGLEGWVERLGGGRAVRAGLAGAAAALVTVLALPAFVGPHRAYVEQDRREVADWREIGRWFGANAPRDASIAVIPAGAIPYFSGLETIDMLGLNDPVIARRPLPAGAGQAGHEKHDPAYVLARRPTYILVGVYGLAASPRPAGRLLRPYYPAERELLRMPELGRDYALRTARVGDGYFAYFARRSGK